MENIDTKILNLIVNNWIDMQITKVTFAGVALAVKIEAFAVEFPFVRVLDRREIESLKNQSNENLSLLPFENLMTN